MYLCYQNLSGISSLVRKPQRLRSYQHQDEEQKEKLLIKCFAGLEGVSRNPAAVSEGQWLELTFHEMIKLFPRP